MFSNLQLQEDIKAKCVRSRLFSWKVKLVGCTFFLSFWKVREKGFEQLCLSVTALVP